MLNLQKKLFRIKGSLEKENKKDTIFREAFKEAIKVIFNNSEIGENYIKDFYIQHKRLIIITTHKTFANELFMRRYALLERLRSHGIQEISIR